ncbi:hypothetical protein [Nocardia niigatensis]
MQYQRVTLVSDSTTTIFGSLRPFRDHTERGTALAFIAAANPIVPALLDVTDSARSSPSIILAWAPGGSARRLVDAVEPDDLLSQLEAGRRWKPAEALRLLIPLGRALDRLATLGFVPVELSPDHLVENAGSLRLVGIGRHLYRPGDGNIPDPCGMSLATTQLLCGDILRPNSRPTQWRALQMNLLLRLAAWMCGGLPPSYWGEVSKSPEQSAYLEAAGFATNPVLRPGRLAETLSAAADIEQAAEARDRIRRASCVLFFDEAGAMANESREDWQRTLVGMPLSARVIEVDQNRLRVELDGDGEKWPFNVFWSDTPAGTNRTSSGYVDLTEIYTVGQTVTVVVTQYRPLTAQVVTGSGAVPRGRRRRAQVRVNAESIRLGLLCEHGPDVVAIAAVSAARQARAAAALLSGAGWVIVDPSEINGIARNIGGLAPNAHIYLAGRAQAGLTAWLPPDFCEIVLDAPTVPTIAGRNAASLPFVSDPDFKVFSTEVLPEQAGAAAKRRTFAPAWALSLNEDAFREKKARKLGRQLVTELEELNSLYGADSELLIRVVDVYGREGLRREQWTLMRARLQMAAPILRGMPAGELRNDLTHALLSRTIDTLYHNVAKWLLPVAPRLSQVYVARHMIGSHSLHQLLYELEGIRKLALLGRLATALSGHRTEELLQAIAAMDQKHIDALLEVPAPSLQFLAGKLGSPELLDALSPFIDGPDLDLLARYTPRAWEMLLTGLRQPEHLPVLGLGWALVVERDHDVAVDARVLIEIARLADAEPRYIVRALLDEPTENWPTILSDPSATAVWLKTFGRLDVAAVLRAFPDASRLFATFSPNALRAAAASNLDSRDLQTLSDFSSEAGVSAADVVTTFLDIGGASADIAHFAGPARAHWVAEQCRAGKPLDDAIADLIETPEVVRTWLVDGEDLPHRVLAGVLGAEPASLGLSPEQGRSLVQLLESKPSLLELTRTLMFPSQRLRLLLLAEAHPDHDLATTRISEALPELLDEPRAEVITQLIIRETLTPAQARFAVEHGLAQPDRALIQALGPLTPTEDLMSIARTSGAAAARETAVLSQTRPSAPTAIREWGPRWIPIIASDNGAAIARLLADNPCPSEKMSEWLLLAGDDGLAALANHRRALLNLVVHAEPPPGDVSIIGAILEAGGDTRSYEIIARNGITRTYWTQVIDSEYHTEADLLLHLWSSDGWHPPDFNVTTNP